MEIWISLGGLAFGVLSWVIASAVRHGKLQQRVTVLERDVSNHGSWRDSIGQELAQLGRLHKDMANVADQLRGISTSLGDLRSSLSRMEGYHEAQRERATTMQRRDTIPP